jgi:alpha-N-arabinofuranosidase
MTFSPAPGEQAGITVIQNDKSALLLTLMNEDGTNRVALTQSLYDETGLLAAADIAGDTVSLRVSGDYLDYRFWYSIDGENWQQLGDVVDGTALSPYALGGYNYTGVYIGLYATSNGQASDNHADYEFFSYTPTGAARDDWYHRQIEKQRHD